MKLSIITVNLNNKSGLQKTFDSVINQTNKNFEWIVVDGASTDGSVEIIKDYAAYISRWISEPDKGVYHAMNKGILEASGDYLLFLNSGDILHSINTINDILHDKLEEDIVIYDIRLNHRDKIVKKDLSLLSSLSVVSFLLISTFPHQSTLIKKTILKDCGMYNLNYKIVADWALFYEACVIKNASYVYKEGIIISEYDMTGLSSTYKDIANNERKVFLNKYYSERMIQYLVSSCNRELQQINLNRPIYKMLYKSLLWFSNKL